MTSVPIKFECRHLWKVFGDKAVMAAQQCHHDGGSSHDVAMAADAQGGIIGARDVSFSVGEGELFVVMGLSGSGKSTVLRCLAQLQPPTLGQVMLDGQDLTTLPEKDLMDIRRHKMGMVFQNFGLVPHFTALQNIAFPLKVRGDDPAACAAKAQEMLTLVGLDGRGDAFPAELSGGQQQRVGIARSLAVDPEVWLLDEPFSALDPLIRRQLQDELLDLQSSLKKSILFITHDFAEAVKLADKIAIMRDGLIIQQGTAAELLLNPADDYVRSFVEDVPRLQVLTLADVMTACSPKAGKTAASSIQLAASTSLETAMIALTSGGTTITVMDKGQTVGTVDKSAIIKAVEG
ncbi:MAG: ATP-binding cassette domain-containing protein [Alphaproteobacteria bacterium]|nr:ATP-binding cassette domain-containing protein [Alphaproteobacteria bacterium]